MSININIEDKDFKCAPTFTINNEVNSWICNDENKKIFENFTVRPSSTPIRTTSAPSCPQLTYEAPGNPNCINPPGWDDCARAVNSYTALNNPPEYINDISGNRIGYTCKYWAPVIRLENGSIHSGSAPEMTSGYCATKFFNGTDLAFVSGIGTYESPCVGKPKRTFPSEGPYKDPNRPTEGAVAEWIPGVSNTVLIAVGAVMFLTLILTK
jgi:hypothetical protein